MGTAPLTGLRVVDFTHVFAGPYATQILGDMGADVIKIERVDGGDPARYYGLEDGEEPLSPSFVALNRNKRSLAVDVSDGNGRKIVRRLIAGADIVVENFRPGVMARLGIDYKNFAGENPGLIYCSISGFGQEGPLAHKAANDLVMQAYSGLLSITGEPGRPPVRCPTAISDFSAGLHAVIAIVGALLSRASTGRGQRVEVSMLESQVSIMGHFFAEYWMNNVIPTPLGTANRLGFPNQTFATSDGWVAITAANDRMWERCCEALDLPDLGRDERFSSLAGRSAHREELVSSLTAGTLSLTTRQAVLKLEEHGVSCAPIQDVPTVASDPQLHDSGTVLRVAVGDRSEAAVIGSPLHFAETPVVVNRGVPSHGQHSWEILEELGYSGSEICEFAATNIVGVSGRPS